MKKFLGALIILFALNFSLASAEIVTVEGKGRYVTDKMIEETIRACTEHARDAALLDAANNAGGVLRVLVNSKVEE